MQREPYDYGIQSAEKNRDDSRSEGALNTKVVVAAIIFSVLLNLLQKVDVPFWVALVISITAVYLPAYWFDPRPKISFLRYALVLESFLAAMLIAVWPIPALLRRVMPFPLAYALPLLSLALLTYFLLPKVIPFLQRPRLAMWGLGCVILAALIAGAVTVFPGIPR